MFCPSCGTENPDTAQQCSQCSRELVQAPDNANTMSPKSLWSPGMAAFWSLFFTPVFGAFIHRHNWRELGKNDRASSSSIWMWLGGIGFVLLGFLVPELLPLYSLVWILAWYFISARSQSKYIQEAVGDNYQRKSWLLPVFMGFVLIVAAGITFSVSMSDLEEFQTLAGYDTGDPATVEAYHENGVDMVYRKAQLGDYERGTKLATGGMVAQIVDDRTVMLHTEYHDYIGYAGQPVFLRFSEKPRLIENDEIIILGRYGGTQRYRTVLGQETSNPLIHVDHYFNK